MNTEIELRGIRELGRQLDRLDQKLAIKALRSAMQRAMLPMLKAARANAMAVKDSGALAAAMGRWSRARKGSTGGVLVNVFLGPKATNKRALALWNAAHPNTKPIKRLQHAHLVEFGSEEFPQPRPVLRNAYMANRIKVVQDLKSQIRRSLLTLARK